jgi:hypothetical protein
MPNYGILCPKIPTFVPQNLNYLFMKSAGFIVAIVALILLGIQFFMRAAETKAYKTGAGAIAPVSPDDFSAAKLYGGTRPSSNAPATAAPDSTQNN